jgi:2-methylisocitrate lyase-like PEP mutase family enzyme
VLNLVIGGKTPMLDAAEAAEADFGMVFYANAALQGAIIGMQAVLRTLKEKGRLDETSDGPAASFAERQRLMQKPLSDELERRYTVN